VTEKMKELPTLNPYVGDCVKPLSSRGQ